MTFGLATSLYVNVTELTRFLLSAIVAKRGINKLRGVKSSAWVRNPIVSAMKFLEHLNGQRTL